MRLCYTYISIIRPIYISGFRGQPRLPCSSAILLVPFTNFYYYISCYVCLFHVMYLEFGIGIWIRYSHSFIHSFIHSLSVADPEGGGGGGGAQQGRRNGGASRLDTIKCSAVKRSIVNNTCFEIDIWRLKRVEVPYLERSVFCSEVLPKLLYHATPEMQNVCFSLNSFTVRFQHEFKQFTNPEFDISDENTFSLQGT